MNATQGCTATVVLTEAEVQRMNLLPDAQFEANTESHLCDFVAHGPEVLHARLAQGQYDDETQEYTHWWLRWSDAGHRELKTGPSCDKLTGEDGCLFVAGHPGECDDGLGLPDGPWALQGAADEWGWAWEVLKGESCMYVDEDIPQAEVVEAQQWAAEEIEARMAQEESQEESQEAGPMVIVWEPDPSTPNRWTLRES